MKITARKIFGSWLIAFTLFLGLILVGALAEASVTTTSSLQETFEENEILLNEMTEEMNQLLVQIEAIHRRGGLPVIELPLDIQINTFDLLRGFMNGINIPFLVNIGGIGRLNEVLFNHFTYTTLLSGNLGFPNGILNGSNAINNIRLPQQSLEARVATQEYLLYVTDAIRGALRLIVLMDTEESYIDIADVLSGARSFLEFNMTDFNQKRDEMYRQFGSETITMGGFISVTRNISDIVGSVDGGGYNFLIDIRNALLGSQSNVNILIEILEYAERVVSGEITEKYQDIDFTDTNAGVDQMFGYLIVDVREARGVLAQFDRLTEPFTTLLNQQEGGITALIFSQLPESLEFIADDIFEDIENVQDVLAYLDTVVLVLEDMRVSMQEVDLTQSMRFMTEILSGEIFDKYLELQETSGLHFGAFLRYIRDDIDGAIMALEVADLFDQELTPLLRGRRFSSLVVEYIAMVIPDIINAELESMGVAFDDQGIGEEMAEMLASGILSFDLPELIGNLRSVSDSLYSLIPLGEQLELLLMHFFVLNE